MKKILLFGGSGLVGSRIREILSTSYAIIAPTRSDVDVADASQATESMRGIKPDVIIYAAAISNPDVAEKKKEYAMLINATAPGVIASLAAKNLVPVLYLSTDAVFPGDQKERPYKEDDVVDPVNYYGFTKQKGEENVLDAFEKNCVLRLITVYSHFYPRKQDLARLAVRAFQSGEEFTGIIDQYFNPTYVDDAVWAIDYVIKKKIHGVLHFGAADSVSNYEFVKRIARIGGFSKANIREVALEDFYRGTRTKRGRYVWLDTSKAKEVLGEDVVLPIDTGIQRFWQNFSSQ